MSQQELLIKVVRTLEVVECPYMLTGSFASSLYGEPRLSHDIDLVVSLSERSIPHLLQSFPPPEYLLDDVSIREALAGRSMFDLIHTTEGDKVDFWLLTDEPFDIIRFKRRKKVSALGLHLYVSTPEDTILAKLRWAVLSGGSEKQFLDALGVYEVQGESLDMPYLKEWVERLDLGKYWDRLVQESSL
jgi:hypothetical protein